MIRRLSKEENRSGTKGKTAEDIVKRNP